MRILSSRLRGFGRYRNEVEINWASLGPRVVLVAPKGTGKSFLLGSPAAALFGSFPGQGGGIYDQATQGGNGDAEVSCEFELNEPGVAYRATRSILATDSTRSQAAWIERDGEVVAGDRSKIGNFNEWVAANVCTKADALESWFSAQNGEGDICKLEQCERRSLFAKQHGIDRLNHVVSAAKSKSKELRDRLLICRAQLTAESPDELREKAAAAERDAEAAEKEAEAAGRRREEAERELEAIRAELEAAQTERATVGEAQRELEAAKRAEADAEKILRQAEASLKAAQREQGRLVAELQAAREAAADVEAVRAKAAELPGIEERGRELKRRKDAWDAAQRDVAAYKTALAAQERAESAFVATLTERAAELDKLAERAEERAKKAPDVPGPKEVCETCPLMEATLKDASEARSNRRAAETTRRWIENPRLARDTDHPRPTPAVERAFANRADAIAALERATAAVASVDTDATDPTPEIEALRPAFDAARLASARLPDLERQAARVAELEAELVKPSGIAELAEAEANALQSFDDARLEREAAWVRAQDEGAAFRAAEEKIGKIKRSIDRHVGLLRDQVGMKEALLRDATRFRTQAEALAERAGALDAVAAEANALDIRVGDLEYIADAFGPSAIQVMLIEARADEINDEMYGFMQRATGGQFTARIVTQRANRDGSLREVFEIAVTDESGERDVTNYSGGEQETVSRGYRISAGIVRSQRSGFAMRQLFMDEPFSALDADSAGMMIDLLRELEHRFDQIIIVTHNADIASQFPCVLRLRRTAIGCEVLVEGREVA